jgi:hypothetical protein
MGLLLIEFVAAGVVLLALSLVPLVLFTVRRRIKAQETLLADPTGGADTLGEPIGHSWQYVATTLGADGAMRLWAFGLWQRGWCQPSVRDGSLRIVRKGSETLEIAKGSIRRIVSGAATIGRGVESGGLLGIVWENSGQILTTWLRSVSTEGQQILKNEIERELS